MSCIPRCWPLALKLIPRGLSASCPKDMSVHSRGCFGKPRTRLYTSPQSVCGSRPNPPVALSENRSEGRSWRNAGDRSGVGGMCFKPRLQPSLLLPSCATLSLVKKRRKPLPRVPYRRALEGTGENLTCNVSGLAAQRLSRLWKPSAQELAEMLVKIKTARNLSTRGLGSLLGVSGDTARKWCKLQRTPSGCAVRMIWLAYSSLFQPQVLTSPDAWLRYERPGMKPNVAALLPRRLRKRFTASRANKASVESGSPEGA